MARRLATEYIKAVLEVSEAEFNEFVSLFQNENFRTEVKICENGDREITLYDKDHQIPLSFKKQGSHFEFEGSYRICDVELAGVMRKAVKQFKGFAIVHRIYANFTMVYHYDMGTVVKIAERSGQKERVIYEYRNPALELERLFMRQGAEDEIAHVKREIDRLLDLRNRTPRSDRDALLRIDKQLAMLAHQLFVLEA
jgi:hypothetical protein